MVGAGVGCGMGWGVVGAHTGMCWCLGSLVRWNGSEGWEDDGSRGVLLPRSELSWWAWCHLMWPVGGKALETVGLQNMVEGSKTLLRPQRCRCRLVIKGN